MMKKTHPYGFSPFFGWTIATAGLSIVCLIAALAWLLIWQVNQQLIHTDLEQKLQTRNHFHAKEIVDNLFRQPKFFSFALPGFSSPSDYKVKLAIDEIFEIIALTGQRKVSEAHERFIILYDQQLELLAKNGSFAKTLESFTKEIEQFFAAFQEEQKYQKIDLSRQKVLLQKRHTILQRQELITREISRLTALGHSFEKDELNSNSQKQEPRLIGEPSSNDIPISSDSVQGPEDHLADWNLEKQLDEEEAFLSRIKPLQDANQAVVSELKENELGLKKVEQTLVARRKTTAKIISKLLHLFCEVILVLSKPSPIPILQTRL